MQPALQDIRRAILTARVALRWGTRPAIAALLGRPMSIEALSIRLRRFVEDMGATFVKLGQYLAIRLDLLPPETCRELSRLFAAAAPLDMATIADAIERETGRPLQTSFASFNAEPVGAASIAQVHLAALADGQRVAVKVQRPGVDGMLRADLRILHRLARLADAIGFLGSVSVTAIVDELAEFTLREIDFRQEAETARRVRADTKSYVYVPFIVDALTTQRILVMEFIDGVSLLEVCERAEAGDRDAFATLLPGIRPHRLMEQLVQACMRQLFVTGYFHGDPHPANILVKRDGTIVLIDFGIFGRLDEARRQRLSDYMAAIAGGAAEQAFRHYTALIETTEETDFHAYRRATLAVMRRWLRLSRDPAAPTEERIAARYQGAMLGEMRRYGVRLRPDTLLFWRVIGVLDATAHRLPIEFDLLAEVGRFFARTRPGPFEQIGTRLAAQARRLDGPTVAGWLRTPTGAARRRMPNPVTLHSRSRSRMQLRAKAVSLMLAALSGAVMLASLFR